MNLFECIDIQVFTDAVSVGALAFVGGALLPWPFRLVAYVVEMVRKVVS